MRSAVMTPILCPIRMPPSIRTSLQLRQLVEAVERRRLVTFGQTWESDHITHSVNVGLSSAVIAVDGDSAARIRFDAGSRKIKIVHIALAPHGIKQRIA